MNRARLAGVGLPAAQLPAVAHPLDLDRLGLLVEVLQVLAHGLGHGVRRQLDRLPLELLQAAPHRRRGPLRLLQESPELIQLGAPRRPTLRVDWHLASSRAASGPPSDPTPGFLYGGHFLCRPVTPFELA